MPTGFPTNLSRPQIRIIANIICSTSEWFLLLLLKIVNNLTSIGFFFFQFIIIRFVFVCSNSNVRKNWWWRKSWNSFNTLCESSKHSKCLLLLLLLGANKADKAPIFTNAVFWGDSNQIDRHDTFAIVMTCQNWKHLSASVMYLLKRLFTVHSKLSAYLLVFDAWIYNWKILQTHLPPPTIYFPLNLELHSELE